MFPPTQEWQPYLQIERKPGRKSTERYIKYIKIAQSTLFTNGAPCRSDICSLWGWASGPCHDSVPRVKHQAKREGDLPVLVLSIALLLPNPCFFFFMFCFQRVFGVSVSFGSVRIITHFSQNCTSMIVQNACNFLSISTSVNCLALLVFSCFERSLISLTHP